MLSAELELAHLDARHWRNWWRLLAPPGALDAPRWALAVISGPTLVKLVIAGRGAVDGEHYPGPVATGENLFSLQDARNLIRYGGMRPDRDVLQFDPTLGYGLTEYLRILDMLRAHGWSPRRCVPHGGHQFSLHIAAAMKLGGNESYPGEFYPTGGFADDAVVVDSQIKPPETLGIGFERKAAFYRVLRELHS